MIKTPCPQSETLANYVLGTMDAAEMQNLERHMLECQACCDQAETLNPRDEVTKSFGLPKKGQGPDEEVVNNLIERVAKFRSAASETCSIQISDETNPIHDQNSLDVSPTDLLSPPSGPDELGRLGDYRILKILGSGGMGFVFLAEDERLRRRVALKVMKPLEARKKGAKDRFLREARATAAVDHDNVIAIHQVGEDRGIPFIAMPMLQGASLKTILERDKRLSQRTAVSICRQAAAGLFAAHRTGLIHRDIKPDNLWIESTKGRLKILDFGLVRDMGNDEGLTMQGTVLGTPSYMSPEQASGEAVDHRSDLFSLGAVLYQMLSGVSPYAASTLTATLLNVARAQPTPIETLVGGLDPDLAKLVTKLNARDPKDRPQSADEVVTALEKIGARLASQRSASQAASSESVVKTTQPIAIPSILPSAQVKRPISLNRPLPAKKPPKTPWGKISMAGAAAAAFLFAITFFVRIGEYDVQITLDDPAIALKIDGEDVLIDDGKAITRLSAGSHKLLVQRDGFLTATDEFTVSKDGKNIIHVSLADGRIKIDDGSTPTTQANKLGQAKINAEKDVNRLPSDNAMAVARPIESNTNPSSSVSSTSVSGSNLPDVRAAEWLRTQDLRFYFRLQSRLDQNKRWEYLSNSTQPLPSEPYLVEQINLFPPFTDKHQDASAEQIALHIKDIRELVSLNIFCDFMSTDGFRKVLELPEFLGVTTLEMAGAELSDEIFDSIANLPNLARVSFAKTPRLNGEGISKLKAIRTVTGVSWTMATPSAKSLEELSQLPRLDALYLNTIEFSEEHLAALTKLKIRMLHLLNAGVDDVVAKRLATMTQLEYLDINFGKITDEGLQALQSLKSLKTIDLRSNLVTAEGMAAFKKALPKCEIVFE